jgi:antitoxin VapB
VGKKRARAKLFWSGGSQAVRLPKEMRLKGSEVVISRRGAALVLEAIPEGDNWEGFWERLQALPAPLRRWSTRSVERRRPI